MMQHKRLLASFAAIAAFAANSAHAAASDTCKQETQALNDDGFLSLVQDDVYDAYVTDFNDVCDFGNFECSITFNGTNTTYAAVCGDKGGQVLTRSVQVSCGVSPAVFDYELGMVPVCIGISCDPDAIDGTELNETRVEQLLTDLKVTGCSSPGGALTAANETCKQETQALNDDGFLSLVQGDLYDAYVTDFNDVCDFGNFECSITFDGSNRTYVAACEDKGGQVLTRGVQVSCGVSPAVFNSELGMVPACIGISCDPTAIDGTELNETRVEQLLTDLKVTGCSTSFSGASMLLQPSSLGGALAVITLLVGAFVI